MFKFNEKLDLQVGEYRVKGEYKGNSRKAIFTEEEITLNGKVVELNEKDYLKLLMDTLQLYENGKYD